MVRVPIAIMLLVCLLCGGCKTTNRDYTSRPARSLTHPDNDLLEMNAVAWHRTDSVTAVYLEIINENLLYKRPDTTLAFYSELRLSYRLLAEPNSRKIIDSGSVRLSDRSNSETVHSKSLFTEFNVKARFGANYFIELEALDLNKKVRYTRGLQLYKQSAATAQNFLVMTNGQVVFHNHFLKGDTVTIRNGSRAVAQYTVDWFKKEYGPAPPPFSTRSNDEPQYKPDSTSVANGTDNQITLVMPQIGFVHVRTDPQTKEGLTLFVFDSSFPGVGSSDQMIQCTRYIMNREEFDQCAASPEKKSAIDHFWLTLGGSNERARELLKRYYARVKEANKLYSSYLEGWKTDRGMIFIVFGPPGNTYQSRKDEIWVYGNEANPATLRFVFNKVQNPFSENDYVMERSPFYRDVYYSAVDFWRQGNVYLEGKK